MKKSILVLMIILSSAQAQAQIREMWTKIYPDTNSVQKMNNLNSTKREGIVYKLDEAFFKKKLSETQLAKSKKAKAEILIPNMDGNLEKYIVWESSNFDTQLQAKYPDIRAYEGINNAKKAKLYLSISPMGIQTMVLRSDNSSEFIESSKINSGEYTLVTSKNRDTASKPFDCNTKDSVLYEELKARSAGEVKVTNGVFRTLRLALSCTGEYTAFFGGKKADALAAMNATMTRVNGIFSRDLSLKLIVIANNDELIFTDAERDPYSIKDNWEREVQKTLTSVIGENNYDIGHLFSASDGGGHADCIGCVCVNFAKGSAYTSKIDPYGDAFDIDYVSHEMAHQLGANHTFSYDIEGTGVSVEPGSGSTIMGYAGITLDLNVEDNSDDYFAYASILQIHNNLKRKFCPVSIPFNDNIPYVDAGPDYTIPVGTAFVLKGTGNDIGKNEFTYCWEENDSAVTTSGSKSICSPSKPDGPLFRSLRPSSSPIRYMPDLNLVLLGKLSSTWESVSTIARTLHFTLTVRNNGTSESAQTNTDEMIVKVSNTAGPFAVTSQNTDDIGWLHGTSQIISWDVKNTDKLEGSANVNIKLSIDGGLTFPIILAANTPNDGYQTITVPEDVTAVNCRILIEPTENIYYAVNSKSFAIGYNVESVCTSYSLDTPIGVSNELTDITRTVNVGPDTGTISDVNVLVGLTHVNFSDVEMQLINPQGIIVRLFDRNCTNAGTLQIKYDDLGENLNCSKIALQTVTPKNLLSAFNNFESQGVWKFKIKDAHSGKSGLFDYGSIEICTKKYKVQTLQTIETSKEQKQFIVYPNPNNGYFTLEFDSESATGVKVFIYNNAGVAIYHNSFNRMPNFKQDIQLNNRVEKGGYFLVVYDGNKKMIKKIIIE